MTAGLPRSDMSDSSLYIINLTASAAPMALEAPNAPELAGFAVFRSRRVEDGRDRYRLHLGYFDSQEQAEKFLPLLRERYPAAWVAHAPPDSMGSLDDTSVAQFKFIPQQKLAARPKQPAAASIVKPASAQPAIKPVSAFVPKPIPAPAAVPAAAPVRASTAPAGMASVHPASAAQPDLAPVEVLKLLESTTSRPAAEAKAPAVIDSNQRFAVQLVWSEERVDTARIPQLAIFDAYTLYTVQVQRAGRRWYGLRLGFFSDPISARQVSLYARSDFAASSVVPVSERECDRAADAAEATLKKETRVEAKPPAPKPPTPPPQAAAAKPAAPAKPKQPAKSAAEFLQQLAVDDVSFNSHEDDPLNDTGVRHLSVSVIGKKSKSSSTKRRA